MPLVVAYTTAALVSLLSALVFTPLLRAIALEGGLVDVSDGRRKLHDRATPPIGGLTIALAMYCATLASMLAPRWTVWPALPQLSPNIVRLLIGAAAMLGLGIVDDVRALGARYKLFGQAVIAAAVCASGFHIGALTLLGGPALHLSVPVAGVLTAVWLVGVTNAFNLIDGVDGLAPGAAVVGLTALTVIGALNHHAAAPWVTAMLAAATLGVLRYNVHPASVFLGDGGSLLLGFVLASFAIVAAERPSGTVDALVPVIVLGLPILDTSIAVTRRFLRGQPIFAPDRGHIHHRLLNRGHSPGETAGALCGACAVLGAAGAVVDVWPRSALAVLAVLGLAAAWFVRQLRIDEFEELADSFARGAGQRQGIQRSVRLREVCSTLTTASDIHASLDTLADTLAEIGIERSEIRLREDFIHGVTLHASRSALMDEVVVWWCGRSTAHDDAWQISFPLFTPSHERVGSLTLWEPARLRAESLGHWKVIGQQLCTAMAPRLSALSRSVAPAAPLRVDAPPPRRGVTQRAASQ